MDISFSCFTQAYRRAKVRGYWSNKDVDGFHPANFGKMALEMETFLPATFGIMQLLERYKVETSGKHTVVDVAIS
jgi:5,10-methylene-tetrahydrofolate dehydrogenase/methenyl tetrahydrofolate cyclohydrolase